MGTEHISKSVPYVIETATSLSTTYITTCPTCAEGEKATAVAISTVTVTKSGAVTEYATYCPLTVASHTKVSSGVTATASVVVSEKESGVFTVYTTYCPLSITSTKAATTVSEKTLEGSISAKTVAEIDIVPTVTFEGATVSTTHITTCVTCPEDEKTTVVGISAVTIVESGATTESMKYYPLTTTTHETVSSGVTSTGSVVISEKESGFFTVYTTYYPMPTTTSEAVIDNTATEIAPVANTDEVTSITSFSTIKVTASGSGFSSTLRPSSSAITVSSYEGSAVELKISFTTVLFGLILAFL